MRESKSVIFALVDLPMTVFTDWDLLSVQHSENAIEAYGLPFIGQFADVPDVVHHDRYFLCCPCTDATWFS